MLDGYSYWLVTGMNQKSPKFKPVELQRDTGRHSQHFSFRKYMRNIEKCKPTHPQPRRLKSKYMPM